MNAGYCTCIHGGGNNQDGLNILTENDIEVGTLKLVPVKLIALRYSRVPQRLQSSLSACVLDCFTFDITVSTLRFRHYGFGITFSALRFAQYIRFRLPLLLFSFVSVPLPKTLFDYSSPVASPTSSSFVFIVKYSFRFTPLTSVASASFS